MRKIFIVGNYPDYINWMQGEETKVLEEADLVCFCGGEDVSSFYYQQPEHPTLQTNPERDKKEITIARKAISLGIPLIGICRGSQLLCVLAGGDLIQDQINPSFRHIVKLYDGREMEFTSTHHNAQYPFVLPEEEYKILGWTENICKYHKNGWDEEVAPPKEVEICYYSEINGLAIQPHPEMMQENEVGVIWLQTLLNKFMNNEL